MKKILLLGVKIVGMEEGTTVIVAQARWRVETHTMFRDADYSLFSCTPTSFHSSIHTIVTLIMNVLNHQDEHHQGVFPEPEYS